MSEEKNLDDYMMIVRHMQSLFPHNQLDEQGIRLYARIVSDDMTVEQFAKAIKKAAKQTDFFPSVRLVYDCHYNVDKRTVLVARLVEPIDD